MIVLGIVLGIIGVRVFDRYKNRKAKMIQKAYQEGYNVAKLGKFDSAKEA